jgi:ABC-type transport system involved in cytochrome bd biosynthesis fused ATPase/permease subunit
MRYADDREWFSFHGSKGVRASMQSGDLRHDQAFFGRSEELYELTHNLQRGRHTLLVGEKGIGKSRLMLEARKIFSGVIFINGSLPINTAFCISSIPLP